MKNFKIIVYFFIATVVFFGSYFGMKIGIGLFKSAKKDLNENTLTVGTSLDYPPYEFVETKTGAAAGFDIELVTELALRMQKKLIIKNMPFTSLIFGLLINDVDMVAAGMSPTESRARMVQFTQHYVITKPLVIVSKKSVLQPTSVKDLYGKRVAVNTGYISDMKMSEHPEINLVRLDTPADGFMAIAMGTVDAFVSAATNVETFLKNQTDLEKYYLYEIPETPEGCVFAVNKSNQELCAKINTVLDQMREDGTLQKLQTKWNL